MNTGFLNNGDVKRLLEAILVFHSAGPWDEEKRAVWFNGTQHTEATTKVMCDRIRYILERMEAETDA